MWTLGARAESVFMSVANGLLLFCERTSLVPRKSGSREGKLDPGSLSLKVGPPRPGDVLRLFVFESKRVTQDELATAIGVSRYSVNQLVNNHRAITPEMALRLGRATDTSAEFWLNLQRNADLFDARKKLAVELKRIRKVV